MEFARRVWKLLVAIKDGLVLAAMLAFFVLLAGALSGRDHGGGVVTDGALRISLKGQLVEEASESPGITAALAGGATREVRERDVLRGLHEAILDDHIKAVVIDLTGFLGGGIVHLEEIGAAMDAVRAAKKPVLLYGFAMEDGGTLLAAHASEAWVDPLGGAFLPGVGGERLYFAGLLQRFGINVHVFRVGTYKDFVEPYIRADASGPSKAATKALYDAVWADIKSNIAQARPKANVAAAVADPVGLLKAAGGDGAKAALDAGLVDRIGTHTEFGERVAALAGRNAFDQRAGAYAHTNLADFLNAHPENTHGKAVGVVTIAGDIVDGKAGPGTAGGDRIAALIDQAVADGGLAALVVRVDSPGGSVTGGEAIRAAILRAKAKGLPIVTSMANYAASGGYWVSTPATRIFAEPATITGSIGIFAIVPSFEKLLGRYGVTSDGYRTSPIAGQPDVASGLTPESEAMIQAEIDNGYARFLGIVAESRHRTPAQIDTIAQGRAWNGASAKANGLIDGYGGLNTALSAAAAAAHLADGGWHAQFLETPPKRGLAALVAMVQGDDDEDDQDAAARDWLGLVAHHQQAGLAAALAEVLRVTSAEGAQAYCMACAPLSAPAAPPPAPAASRLLALLGRAL